jgi:signal transduction histidine kinase
LILVVVALVTIPTARRISRPLERLTSAARRLGGGDLSTRVPVAGPARAPWQHRRRHDELAELTRAFNEMADRMERLVRGQRELLANVSHELRSPLTRIRMALELLPPEAASEARLRGVEADLADLERLIDDVLTAARLDEAGLPARLDALDARGVLADVAERARHDPLVDGRTIRVVDGPPIPLTADGALLRRAVWNLVENAAKYGAPPITLAAERVGDRVTLSIADEGPGIPAAEREQVFTPFYRGDRARTPDGAHGVGLGLTLARRIAEVHGGSIAVEAASTAGGHERGCRVVITLPADHLAA